MEEQTNQWEAWEGWSGPKRMGELLEALHRWKPENFCEAGGGRWKALVGDVWLEFAPAETPGEFEAAEAILERAIAHAVREERWPYRTAWAWDSYGASILRNGEWHITSHLESTWEALGWAAISAAGLEDCALVVEQGSGDPHTE